MFGKQPSHVVQANNRLRVCVCVQVVEELWEEEFIERCIQELLEEEEQWEWFIPSRDLPSQAVGQLQDQLGLLVLDADVHADADFSVVVSLRSAGTNQVLLIPGNQHLPKQDSRQRWLFIQ